MRCDGVDFEVSGGREIKVDTRGQDIENSRLITYILGTAFGVVGIQRGLIPMHGAAVDIGGAAAIIAGFSGSGKSAIQSALIMDGYKYTADDVSMVAAKSGTPFVIPSYPQRKIAAAAAMEIGEQVAEAELCVEDDRDKYTIRKSSEWLDKELPLTCIVELVPATRKDGRVFAPEIREITGHASLKMVLRNQYRPYLSAGIGNTQERLKQLLEITSSVKTYQVIRPAEGFPLKETARMIAEACFFASDE